MLIVIGFLSWGSRITFDCIGQTILSGKAEGWKKWKLCNLIMNRNNGAQSSCVLLTMIISGCQPCWLWGFKIFPTPTQTDLTPISKLSKRKQSTGCFALQGRLPISFLWKVFTDFYNLVCAYRHAVSSLQRFHDLCSKHMDKDGDLATERALCAPWYNAWTSSGRGSLLSKDCGKVFLLRWAFLKPAESPLHCSSQHHIPLEKSSFLPFISNLLCFLFPEFVFWSFWIWTKPKSQLKSRSILAASLMLLVRTRWNHMWRVWFQACYQPGFTGKPFSRVKLAAVTSLWILSELLSIFWALCCFGLEFAVQQTVPLD